jgi:hypothetical protein
MGGVLAVLVTGRIEIEAPIVVLLTLLRSGVRIMKLNGKSRIKFDSLVIRLWAEVGTSLLHRIEAEATTSDKYVTQFSDGRPVEVRVVTKEFQWDAELNKSIFEPDIPDDYTLMPE